MRFRSPLLSQSRFLSFPPGTEMVHFPGFARTRLWIHRAVRGVLPPWVSPFGNPRIKACFQLSVISSQLHHYTPCKLYSATLLLARLDTVSAAPTADPSLRSG